MGIPVAVLGASGYAGGELVRLLDAHPVFEVAYLGANTSAGRRLGEVHPHLAGGDRLLGPLDPEAAGDAELAFLALPHGASAEPGSALAAAGAKVVDLGADFRFRSAERYESAYGVPHPVPGQVGEWAYGLPELFEVAGSERVSVPGCYPTAALLALAPLLARGLIEPAGITVSAVSGASGAGRGLREELLFGSVAEGVRAYGLPAHRHRPEMEDALEAYAGRSVSLTFVPHLAPFQRGLLATCTAPLTAPGSGGDLSAALREAYAGRPFVEVLEEPPQTRWTAGSNRCLVAAFEDRGTAVVVAALDNLLKGAAGQAVQDANLMAGLDETAGLPSSGWMP